MQGLRYPQLAPSKGPQYGRAIAEGLNGAINNFAKMRMQSAQMQSMQMQRAAQAQFMQSRAANQARQNQDTNFMKVQSVNELHQLASQGKIQFDPDISGKMVAHASKQALDGIQTPADAQNFQQHIQALSQQAGDMTLNPNEQKYASSVESNQTKRDVGAGHDQAMNSRTTAVQEGLTKRTGIMQAGQTARTQAITERNDPETRANLQNMRDLSKQMTQIQQNIGSLDKPPPPGALPIDDATKSALKNSYSNQLMSLHEQYQNSHNKLTGDSPAPQAPAQGPAAQASKQALPSTQWQSAQPGDYVFHPQSGQYLQRLPGNHADGSPNFSASPSALPQGVQAPPSPQGQPFTNGSGPIAPPAGGT